VLGTNSIYKSLHRQVKIGQHEPTKTKTEVEVGSPECQAEIRVYFNLKQKTTIISEITVTGYIE
jgi:hypothetical protein